MNVGEGQLLGVFQYDISSHYSDGQNNFTLTSTNNDARFPKGFELHLSVEIAEQAYTPPQISIVRQSQVFTA